MENGERRRKRRFHSKQENRLTLEFELMETNMRYLTCVCLSVCLSMYVCGFDPYWNPLNAPLRKRSEMDIMYLHLFLRFTEYLQCCLRTKVDVDDKIFDPESGF